MRIMECGFPCSIVHPRLPDRRCCRSPVLSLAFPIRLPLAILLLELDPRWQRRHRNVQGVSGDVIGSRFGARVPTRSSAWRCVWFGSRASQSAFGYQERDHKCGDVLELYNATHSEMEEWDALEWDQLRVEGKPLLSGAAFGTTPLLWVACRAQPCLIHVFCDAQLQDIWRFPADPVFLSIGSGSCPRAQRNGRLLVITRDGCVWIVPLSKTRISASRPSKKLKTQKVGEIQRIQPRTTTKTTLRNLERTPTLQSFPTRWTELAAESYTPTARALEVKNVLVADTLIGTVPGAKVAAFGPHNHVALGSPAGSPELLNASRLSPASDIASHLEGLEFLTSTPVFRRGPTCLLVVSSVRHSQNLGLGDRQAELSQDLFESLSSPSAGASDPEILLIQGGMDGKVCTFHVEKGTVVAPPYTVCDLQQPVVTIIPVAHTGRCHSQASAIQECDEVIRGANWLLVIGLLGRVAFLSWVITDQPALEESNNNSPFLARHPLGEENNKRRPSSTTFKELVTTEGTTLSGPVTSACLVGGARLCYTVGSVVFITEVFGKLGSVENSLLKLPSERICVSNVAAITGPGLFTYKGTHSLVALTGAGRLFSIKTCKQTAGNNLGVDCCQGSLNKAYSGKCVKVSLQSIADAESCKDAIQSHEQALTLAMNELALALPRARDIATDEKKLALETSILTNVPSTSKVETATVSQAGLGCTLTATPVPSTSFGGDQLSFGVTIGFGTTPRKPPPNLYKNLKTRLDVALINHSRTPVSQYWSLILELQSCLSTTSPASHYSFIINNGHGLPVGCQWNHRIHVNLPGGPWGPVMATMYLCHIHDSHKALLQSSELGKGGQQKLGRASSAGCVVLRRQRIDLFSLLQGPQATLGHTSWTPACSGNNNLKTPNVSSFAGVEEIGMLDLADSDTLGSFSGDLTWSCSPDAKRNVSRTVDGAADWQTGFLRYLLQQPSTSTEWKRLRLTAQGGGTVGVAINGRAGQSVVKIQTPGLLLGILFREALLRQLMDLHNTEPRNGNRKGHGVLLLHRKESSDLVARWSEIQALVQRTREASNLWKKFLSHDAPPARDLAAPLLGHTYAATAELIKVYKMYREEL